MAILSIRIIGGDPVLRTVADPVTDFGPELAKLVADMTETMEDVEGAGLAAPQVGVSQRVFTYRIGGEWKATSSTRSWKTVRTSSRTRWRVAFPFPAWASLCVAFGPPGQPAWT